MCWAATDDPSFKLREHALRRPATIFDHGEPACFNLSVTACSPHETLRFAGLLRPVESFVEKQSAGNVVDEAVPDQLN